MKSYVFIAFAIGLQCASTFGATSWDNPAVLCPEELLPKGLACPDFTQLADPYSGLPDGMSKEEATDWINNKSFDLRLCRNREVWRREQIKAGSFSEAALKGAWMVIDGGKQVKEKLEAVHAAGIKYGIPPQILIGALKQESGMSTIGVAPDGGNYSCGMAQINIQEWCLSMNRLSAGEKAALGWPEISCEPSVLPTDSVKAFYEIALKNAAPRRSYELVASDYDGISAEDVGLPLNTFNAVNSFVHNCQNIALSISAKAQNLKNLFDYFVPKALKGNELYPEGKTFPRNCSNEYPTKAYPLHTGWLLAVAMYNAGPVQAKLIGHYYDVQKNKFPAMTPLDLIEALHWGGKWKTGTDSVFFKDQDGNKFSQRWYKSCVVQKHVAKVIQHATVINQSIAKSLEQEPCKPTGVPEYRQNSSGVKIEKKDRKWGWPF